MSKIADIQLRSKAVILAEEGYSCSVIGYKLGQSKGWVAKWVERKIVGHGGALVESIAFNRRVVGSTPALAAM